MKNYKVIVLYILILAFVGCGVKKRSFEKVVERDSIAYVLPSENRLVIKDLCDTLGVPVFVNSTVDNGIAKVNLKVDKETNTLTLETENDTIFKEKISYRDRVRLEEKEVPYVPKWVYWVIIVLLVGWVFPGIPKKLRGLIGFPV